MLSLDILRNWGVSGLAKIFSSPQGKKRRNNLFIPSIFDAAGAKKDRQDAAQQFRKRSILH